MDPFPIATSRLTLRRFRHEDLSSFVAYRSDPQVAQFQDWSSIDNNEARDFLEHHKQSAFGVPGEWFQIAIALSETDVLIGDIGTVIKADDSTSAEIGFTVSRENQGKGFASEAVRAVLRVIFERTAVERIEAITDSRNVASIALLKSIGMRQAKIAQVWFKGSTSTEYAFVLRKEDWLA